MKTDSQLQLDVMAELNWEPAVSAAQITVEVANGVVTLAGYVNNYSEKLYAERAARRVGGVKALIDEMRVKPTDFVLTSDADIAKSVRCILSGPLSLSNNTIQINVEGGLVTLCGDVRWQYQRHEIADQLRHIKGVTGIDNKIAVKPSLTSTIVKSVIEAALKRSAIAEANSIEVRVEGGDVTLCGSVQGWSEREIAKHLVWRSSGVHSVTDKMRQIH